MGQNKTLFLERTAENIKLLYKLFLECPNRRFSNYKNRLPLLKVQPRLQVIQVYTTVQYVRMSACLRVEYLVQVAALDQEGGGAGPLQPAPVAGPHHTSYYYTGYTGCPTIQGIGCPTTVYRV